MKKLIASLSIGIVVAVSAAHADIIPSFVNASSSGDGNTTWAYQIDITSDQQVTTGDFFTIYDFGNFIPGTNVQPAGWTFSSSNTGTNPAQTNAPDDPNIPNLTWVYTGATPIPSGTTLGTFSVNTVGFNELSPTRNSYFAAQATRTTGPTAGDKISNVGQIPVPIPEPSTLSLLALAGIGGLTLWRRRRS